MEIFKRLYENYKEVCTEIVRERPYPGKGSISDFYMNFVTGSSVWIELKVDENNKLNYARLLEQDIRKLEKLKGKDIVKLAVLMSRNNYTSSEISQYKPYTLKTRRNTYRIRIVNCGS